MSKPNGCSEDDSTNRSFLDLIVWVCLHGGSSRQERRSKGLKPNMEIRGIDGYERGKTKG